MRSCIIGRLRYLEMEGSIGLRMEQGLLRGWLVCMLMGRYGYMGYAASRERDRDCV